MQLQLLTFIAGTRERERVRRVEVFPIKKTTSRTSYTLHAVISAHNTQYTQQP